MFHQHLERSPQEFWSKTGTTWGGADGNLNPNVMGQAASISFWDMSPWNVASSTLISCLAYDSRSNAVLSIDPKGNSAVTVFDGASRKIQFQQHMRWRGQGRNPPAHNQTLLPASAGTIVTTLVLDGNGRVALLIDDRGSATRFEFDTLDRETFMIFQDGSTRTNVYDLASDVVTYTDEIGNIFYNVFDALGRKVTVDIAVATGTGINVSTNTQSQSFEFDGLSRPTFARNSDQRLGVSGDYADVNLFYDSIDRTLEDSQTFGGNTRNVTNTKFKSYPVTQFTFPNGRAVDNVYDQLYRRNSIKEDSTGSTFALFNFFGPSRLANMVLGNGLVCNWMNQAGTNSAVQSPTPANPAWGDNTTDRLGYDGAGRMISKRFVDEAFPDTAIIGFTTALDRASNKLYERALHAESRSSLYEPFDANQIPQGGYDSIDRLLQYQRGVLSSTGGCGGNGGGSIALSEGTPEYINVSGTDQIRNYALDSLGNWRNTSYTAVISGGTVAQIVTRQHNGLNEITRTQLGASAPVLLTYDGMPGASNGNLTFDGTLNYQWDALNRMAQALSGETAVGQYFYDAFNRRIRKIVGSVYTDFIYLGWRCFEDRNPNGGDGGDTDTPLLQYIWGRYLDELLQINVLVSVTTGSGDSAVTYGTGFYYPLQDLLYRTAATMTFVDSLPAIVEVYDTDAYGKTLIFNAAGSGSNWWADDAQQVPTSLCQFIFTGQRYDAETGLYYYKRRMYSPVLGRFLSKDPIRLDVDDPEAEISTYGYCRNSPTVATDPAGEWRWNPWSADFWNARYENNNSGNVVSNPLSPLGLNAMLSNAAYGGTSVIPSGWAALETRTTKHGTTARLFYNGSTGKYILAFKGTAFTTLDELKADCQAAYTLNAGVEEALELAKDYHAKYGRNLSFTGHSLGGGLAAMAAIETGADAVTYNAMAVSQAQYTIHGWDVKPYNNITSYYITGEALTNFYANLGASKISFPAQVRPGVQIAIGGPVGISGATVKGAYKLHLMTSILGTLSLPCDANDPPVKK